MATLDEDLRTYLLTDSTIARICGGRVHLDSVPQQPLGPYIWYSLASASSDGERVLGDTAGGDPFRTSYNIEAWSFSARQSAELMRAIFAKLDSANRSVTFGSQTIQGAFMDQSPNDYIPRGTNGSRDLYGATAQVEIVPT